MLKLNSGNRGFTLIEAMLSAAMMAVVSVGVYKLYADGTKMWNYGMAKMSLAAEARLTMTALTKFIQECQGATIRISRIDSNAPANSYISGRLGETVYVTTSQSKCGCRDSSEYITFGDKNDPSLNNVEIFQYYNAAKKNNYLLAVQPVLPAGTDITDPAAVKAAVIHKSVTLSASIDSLMMVYEDSEKNNAINIGARFSKKVFENKPPVTIYMTKTVVIKHQHSGGYYGN